MRALTGPVRAIVAIGLAAACSSPDVATPVTVVGYTVTIKTAAPTSAQVGSSLLITFTVIQNESDSSSKPANGKSFTVTVTAGRRLGQRCRIDDADNGIGRIGVADVGARKLWRGRNSYAGRHRPTVFSMSA